MRTQQEIEKAVGSASEYLGWLDCPPMYEEIRTLRDAATECLSLRTQLAEANAACEQMGQQWKSASDKLMQLQQSLLNLTASNERLNGLLSDMCKYFEEMNGIPCDGYEQDQTPYVAWKYLTEQSPPSTTLATVRKAFELLNDIAKVPGVDLRMVRAAQELISAAKKENLI